MVTLQWTAPASGAAAGYVLEAGSASGLVNLANVRVPGTVFVAAGVAPGLYYVRLRTLSSSGSSAASNEVQVAVAAGGPPGQPSGLGGVVTSGSTVTLFWNAPASGGGAVTGYRVEAGSAPGLANLAVRAVGIHPVFETSGVPPGVYYVRVRAAGPNGAGLATGDVIIVVP